MQKVINQLTKRRSAETNKKSRKKHVESMFLTNKNKKYPNYYKPSSISTDREKVKSLVQPTRRCYSIKVLKGGYVTLKPLKAVVRIFK